MNVSRQYDLVVVKRDANAPIGAQNKQEARQVERRSREWQVA